MNNTKVGSICDNGKNETNFNFCNPYCQKMVEEFSCQISYLKVIIKDLQKDKILLQNDKIKLERDKERLIELFVCKNNAHEEIISEIHKIHEHKTDVLNKIYQKLQK